LDEEGDAEDWIELYNSGSTPVNLQGYFLSDDPTEPSRWSFPNIEIPAEDFLIVFASGKDFMGVQVHTNFKISKSGEQLSLFNNQLEIIDQIQGQSLEEDQSYGRLTDGSQAFSFFFDPSPGLSNDNNPGFNFANPPTFEPTTFFSKQATNIRINCDQPDCLIYYTLDGKIPDENATLYTGPFAVDTTTTIRAAAITPEFLLSKPSTRTFFIDVNHTIPIMALTTDPENLWNIETGIFIKGLNADTISPYFGANFWSDTEIPMHVEYYEQEELKIEYPTGAKIHGGSGARTKKMKPLRLIAKKSFGTKLFEYPFFKNRTHTKFERLVLRNSSGDFNICHISIPKVL